MKALIFYAPKINKGEFEKEARRFRATHGIQLDDMIPVSTKQPLMLRRWKVMRELKKRKGQRYDAVVFFCHGWKNKIQLGFKRKSIPALARRLGEMAGRRLTVVLYCCSCAVPGGIAEHLRNEMVDVHECQVTGHVTAGHTTRNPYVRNYMWKNGQKIDWNTMYRKFKLWQSWRLNLSEDDTFRFRFPFMDMPEILRELNDALVR